MEHQSDFFVVRDLKQIKALADPLRQRIIGALADEPRTTKQVAIKLGEPITKLYRHVEVLEQAGLICLIRTTPKRGTTEKYFQAIAKRFSVASDSLSSAEISDIEAMFAQTMQEVLDLVNAGMRKTKTSETASEYKGLLVSMPAHIPPDRLEEFSQKIQDVVTEFKGCGGPEYKIVLAAAPRTQDS